MKRLSARQKEALGWWFDPRYAGKEAIICDGAVRSGKTMCLGLGFFLWAMMEFRGMQFALCGRSVGALRRNLLSQVRRELEGMGFQWKEQTSRSQITLRRGRRENTFYLFGGKDEASAAAIQGATLAGALLDEAALMPRSFVEQTAARCSVEGARLWFSCNPAGPEHWFYREWICKAEEKRAVYLHFTMEDNPGLSPKVRERYERSFQGTFYRRFVLGEWTAAEGLVYDFFDRSMVQPRPRGPFQAWRISCDYGTVNPASFGLWGRMGQVWYRVEEYYYDSKRAGRQKTDGEYAADLARLAGGRQIEMVLADPSAASFIELLRREGWRVKRADNEVLSGIRTTAEMLKSGRIVICEGCVDCLREIGLYCWDPRGGDRVRKENDHAMDEMRYFAAEAARGDRGPGLAAGTAVRRG